MKKIILLLMFVSVFAKAATQPENFPTGIKTKSIQLKNATELTISSGVITPTQSYHSIDTEGDAATDDLDTITATNFVAGGVVYFKQADNSRDIVFKNGTGNIYTGTSDFTLEDGQATSFVYDGSYWRLAGGGGGGITTPATTTDRGLPLWDGTDGMALLDSGVTVDSDKNIATLNSIQYNISSSVPSHSEGITYWDSTQKTLNLLNEESDVTIQLGREVVVRVYNDTGSLIENGKLCYLSDWSGTASGFFKAAKAQADDAETCLSTIGWATHSIEAGTYGYVTITGQVNGLVTTGCTTGETLYLSSTSAGDYTDTRPDSPAYSITVGLCGYVHASEGTVFATTNVGSNTGDVIKVFNGSVLEDNTTTVSATGGVISLTFEQTGGGDLSLFFDGGFYEFDSTPAASVTLTAGTDTVPVLNYVYIPDSTKTLTANTSGFPTTEQYVPVATVFCQSANTLETDGPLKWHAWTDHLSSSVGQGHMADINYWIRNQNATYRSGSFLTATGGSNVFDVATTAGLMLQLHEHPIDVFDTATGSDAYIVNDSVTPYNKVGDFTAVMADSTGATLSGRYYSLVFWISGNEGSGEDKLYCNLPSGSYNSSSGAISDLSKYSNYTIPSEFKGTGILIARVSVRNQSGAGGTFTINQTDDLRGLLPQTAGSAGGAGGATAFTELTDTPSTYSGEAGKIPNVNSGETGLEFDTIGDILPVKEFTGDFTGTTADTYFSWSGDILTITHGIEDVTASKYLTWDILDATGKNTWGVDYYGGSTTTLQLDFTDVGKPTTETLSIVIRGGGTGGNADTSIHKNVAGEIVAITEKTTINSNDELIIEDYEDSNAKKSLKVEVINENIGTQGINAQTGTTYTLVLADANSATNGQPKTITMTNASANTVTIPTNASVAFPVGSVIIILQNGAGTTTIEGDTGVTVNGTSAGSEDITDQYKSVYIQKLATDTWVCVGAI